MVLGLVLALGAAVAGALIWNQEPPAPVPPPRVAVREEAPSAPALSESAPAPAATAAAATQPSITPEPTAGATPANTSEKPPVSAPVPAKFTPYRPGPKKFAGAVDPMAREALGRVGADPEADTYWIQAINNRTLPANERKDLIEDLNEDGISDPHAPTLKDLAVITGRLQLIDQLLPSAMDKVNADAFREAQKDLLQMRSRVLKQ